MAKFHITDLTGHTTLEFDMKNSSAVKEAMEKFEELMKDGYSAGSRQFGDRDYTQTRQFNAEADETVFVRPIQGG
jgi:hypothetical protein